MLVLIQQIMLPNPCAPSWDKVQTTPAEICCKGGGRASVQLYGFSYMTTYILYWKFRQEVTVSSDATRF